MRLTVVIYTHTHWLWLHSHAIISKSKFLSLQDHDRLTRYMEDKIEASSSYTVQPEPTICQTECLHTSVYRRVLKLEQSEMVNDCDCVRERERECITMDECGRSWSLCYAHKYLINILVSVKSHADKRVKTWNMSCMLWFLMIELVLCVMGEKKKRNKLPYLEAFKWCPICITIYRFW